jgi:hypothetical protein
MVLRAIYFTEMAAVSFDYFLDTQNPLYQDVALDFFGLALDASIPVD